VILGIRHTGIVVTDMEASLHFYRDLLGLEIWGEAVEQGSYIDSVTGLNGVRVQWVKLKAPDGGLIELLQYHSHPRVRIGKVGSADVGCSHVAFTIAEYDDAYEKLSGAGVTFNAAPVTSPNGKARVAYCHDPDGTIIELVEELG
jgi:catechol 2,3-dioxygenase-like lactoylglutathione lyase family enzyme